MIEKPSYEALVEKVKKLERQAVRRKQVENALRESEARYRQLFNIAPAGIYEVDFHTGRIIKANEAVCEYSGYARDELLAINAIDLLTEESKAKFLDRTNRMLNGESVPDTVDYEIIKKDGSIIWLNVSNKYTYAGGHITGSTVVARDITKRKLAEDALIEMNAALNALIKNMESKESRFQEQVRANMQHLVFPYLEKMRTATPDRIRKSLIDIVETNLKKIYADFSHQLSSSLYSLTSTEIKVANLVKMGNTTKEIAATLGIAHKTVESHRERIRKKLGIRNRRINLRAHLLAIK